MMRLCWLILVASMCLACANPEGGAGATLETSTVDCRVGEVRFPTTREAFGVLYAGRSFLADGDHLGIDIALPEGTAVHPIACGRVVFAGPASGYGIYAVVIEHMLEEPIEVRNGLGALVTITHFLSVSGHMRRSEARGGPPGITLHVGDLVRPHDVIGYIANDAENGDGAEHLHLGIRLQSAADAQRVDPRAWFRGYERGSGMRRHFADPADFMETLMRSGIDVRWHPPGSLLVREAHADERYIVGSDLLLRTVPPAIAALDRLVGREIRVSDAEIGCYARSPFPYRAETGLANVVKFDGISTVYEVHEIPEPSFRSFISYEAFQSWGWRDEDIRHRPVSEHAAFLASHRDDGLRRLRNGSLVSARGESEVAVVSDGRRLPVFDWATFLALGYRADRIYEVDRSVIDQVAYPRGPVIVPEQLRFCSRPGSCPSGDCADDPHGGGLGAPDDAGSPPEVQIDPGSPHAPMPSICPGDLRGRTLSIDMSRIGACASGWTTVLWGESGSSSATNRSLEAFVGPAWSGFAAMTAYCHSWDSVMNWDRFLGQSASRANVRVLVDGVDIAPYVPVCRDPGHPDIIRPLLPVLCGDLACPASY